MANPRIDVEIGAKVEGLTAGVNTATGQLDKLGKAAQSTAPQFDKLGKAASGYNSVGIDTARIIQDLPFGIIGVGNNIQQLAGSFQVLKNQTGSTGAAIKQAFASIFSSSNALVLGISILTSAFTYLQMKGFFKTEESAKSLDEQLKKYQETLTGVAAATLKGAQDAQKELAVLKSLELQATNTAISTDKRLEAVNQLQKQYPDYFGNLTQEQILNGEVGNAYLNVAANLLAKAKAQAATNQIAQNGIDLLRIETKLEEQRAKRLQETSAAQAQLDALIQKRQKDGFLTQGDLQRYDTLIKSINNSNESLQEEKTLKDEIARINKENEALTQNITKQIEAGATFTKATKQEVEGVKRTFEEIQNIKFTPPKISFNIEKQSFGGVNLDNVQMQIQQLDALDAKLQGTGISVEEFYYAIANGAAEGFDNLDTFIGRIADTKTLIQNTFGLLQANVTEAFTDLGTSLGEALAGGTNVIKALGNSLLGSVGKLLGDFGKQLIAFGVAGLAYSKLIKSLFTDPITAAPKAGLAIAAGVALVAISGAISSGLKSNSSGGGGGGGSVGSSGVGGGSSFAGGGQGGLFQQNRDVSGEFVVRGQDLVYVLGQANNRINKG